MAVPYPQGNPGIAPVDGSTPVGAFRNSTGNTIYEEYDPVETGYGNYTALSDGEIEQYLAMASDSNLGAIGYWYMALSGQAARESASVADYDLKLDLTKRAADLRATAEWYFGLAGIPLSGDEYFEVVNSGGAPEWEWPPELAPWFFPRGY